MIEGADSSTASACFATNTFGPARLQHRRAIFPRRLAKDAIYCGFKECSIFSLRAATCAVLVRKDRARHIPVVEARASRPAATSASLPDSSPRPKRRRDPGIRKLASLSQLIRRI